MNRIPALLVLALALGGPAALAQGTLEVITLRHRTAEQVIPVLRPLVEPGGVLSGQYNQLIVRTSPANLEQLRQVLASIDRPARRLVISVRFESAASASASGVESDVRLSTRGSRAEVRIEDSRRASEERVDQRLQVLEGRRAVIASGESRPTRERQVVRTPGGTVISEQTVIREAATGFEVVPRLAGDRVTLEISPQRESFAPGQAGAIRSERAASTVSGRLGEWIELGGADTSALREGSGILSSREVRASSGRRIWVRVEELP